MKQEFNQEIRDKVLEFINFCLGCLVKCYEIHWTTDKSQTHNESDSLKWNIQDLTDSVMEQYIGLMGKGAIGSGDINATVIAASNFDELTDSLKERCVEFKNYFKEQKSIYGGIVIKVDNFISNVLVNIYREEMD